MTDEQLTSLTEKIKKGHAIQERMRWGQVAIENVKTATRLGTWIPSRWEEIDFGNGLKGCLPELKEASIDVLTTYLTELTQQLKEL